MCAGHCEPAEASLADILIRIVWGHEMKLTRLMAIAIIAASGGLAALQVDAQIQQQQPAEFPPASYKGKQYVDSQGCVFIRAGIDGNVSWIPRVTRSRKTICGFKPSLSGQVASAAAAPAQPAEAPVQITLNNAPAAAAPAPKPRKVAAPKRKRQAAPVVVRQTAPAPKPQPRIKPAPIIIAAPVPAPAPQVRRSAEVATACRGASPLSQQYLRGSASTPVRCGPQAEPIIAPGYAAGGTRSYAVTASEVTAHARIVPKHVAQNRLNTYDNVRVPPGYKTVWEDGRLNPRRTEQSLAGRSDMLLIWTQTVPRRLINQATGRDLTASVPLVYPYLDIATQRRELGEVTIVQRNGQLTKRIIRNHPASARTPAKRQPVYSSRSAPKSAQPQAAAATPSRALADKRFVQIGTFGNPANAQRAAQNIARMGMAARIGKHSRNGKTYMTVQAGPFHSAQAIQNAMRRLKGAGYSDAFARN